MKFINSYLKALSKVVLFGACCVVFGLAAGCNGSEADKNSAEKNTSSKSEPAGSGTSAPTGSDKK